MYDHKEVKIFSMSYIVNVLKESVGYLLGTFGRVYEVSDGLSSKMW